MQTYVCTSCVLGGGRIPSILSFSQRDLCPIKTSLLLVSHSAGPPLSAWTVRWPVANGTGHQLGLLGQLEKGLS